MYQSSLRKKVLSWSVGWPFEAKLRAASWNGKSRTACILFRVVNCEVNGRVVSKTSPNMKNSLLPCSSRTSSTSGPNFCQNSSSTCFMVSIRKPSMSISPIHVL